MSLKGKNILIGVSAGIAAYKIPYLIRLLKKAGADVRIVITPTAKKFVTPLTLSTLSEHPVLSEPFNEDTGEWNSHVDIALWADLIVVAPATANTMAKMVTGITDNLLTAVCLSARSQIMVAPTMDLDMYKHTVTQHNIDALRNLGHIILEPNTGELASGLKGEGRMQEPQEIFEKIEGFFKKKTPLTGKTALVSAGPTYESIDPVRFIGNHSTGIMGVKIAEALADAGADVILISGPGVDKVDNHSVKQIKVTSAKDMYDVCMQNFPDADIGIMAAAIADFTPKEKSPVKIKKGNKPPAIELVPTEDVLLNMGKIKKRNQILIGFALETDNEIENAKSKLKRKNLDFIVLNSLQDKGAGFGHSTNKVTIINSDNSQIDFPLKSKAGVAKDIVNNIVAIIKNK